ncbi:hypothetical protein ISP17_11240 [Dyella ginsengisoli]|uniref:Uncharacterized protein n=1 Tax=Dyella ginsengisoli TaxID=363848 RepID=A0ABW8JWA6_9GAMM
MIDLKQQAALTALNEMMRGKHFSICTLDKVADLLNVHPDPEAYRTLRALHCIDYAAMPRDLYASLPSLIQQALSGREVFQFDVRPPAPLQLAAANGARPGEVVMIDEPKRPSLLRRMLGHG